MNNIKKEYSKPAHFSAREVVNYNDLLATQYEHFSPERLEIMRTACFLLTTIYKYGGLVSSSGVYIPFIENTSQQILGRNKFLTPGVSRQELETQFSGVKDDLERFGVSKVVSYQELEFYDQKKEKSISRRLELGEKIYQQIVSGSFSVPRIGSPVILANVPQIWDYDEKAKDPHSPFIYRLPLSPQYPYVYSALVNLTSFGPSVLERTINLLEIEATAKYHIEPQKVRKPTRGFNNIEITLQTMTNACLVTAIQQKKGTL